MARYHFRAPNEVLLDDEGVELPHDAAAQALAVEYTGELLKSSPSRLCNDGEWRVEVLKDDHQPIFAVVVAAIPLQA